MSNQGKVLKRLKENEVPFEEYHHEAAHTMEDCLKLPYAAPDVTFCKNILLCNRQKTSYYLYVTDPVKPYRTADVSKLLGSSRLSFATSETLPEMLGLESGSLSPLGLWFDQEKRIQLVLDSDIRKEGRIAFHPCDNTCTVIFQQSVFWNQVLPLVAESPIVLDVPWPHVT